MVEPLPGWVIFMTVVAFIVMVVVLTFSNLGKNEKNKRTNKRRVSPKVEPPRGTRRGSNNFLH